MPQMSTIIVILSLCLSLSLSLSLNNLYKLKTSAFFVLMVTQDLHLRVINDNLSCRTLCTRSRYVHKILNNQLHTSKSLILA